MGPSQAHLETWSEVQKTDPRPRKCPAQHYSPRPTPRPASRPAPQAAHADLRRGDPPTGGPLFDGSSS